VIRCLCVSQGSSILAFGLQNGFVWR
jgi:hypothetical protein